MQNQNNDAPECRLTGDQERGQSYTGESCECGCGRGGRPIPADDTETREKIMRYLKQRKEINKR